ncbi:hypothetical protein Daura_16425 [Dactylosporangium aurantiacum]|uniref:KAP NTPase domain-containing protein n=1 Tax=Dactylosporangium aurantiacum TaxID=35754 RepID=A0A9Q9IPF0_9ACTN|nr:P-loop NTPase fold protein [Dactylosporangium aurantiacum]MDG6103093.1 P-loop NTPase fold protein [Dactylosporangium aurantiacum]UWZ57605.1 hypothetical protein Daura_16425 [Dactylosporangium aurantiacum]
MAELADPSSSQVVLIGVGEYDFLDPIPAVRNNVNDLRAGLMRPELWGVPAQQVHVADGRSDPAAAIALIRTAADDVGPDGLLFVYYAGHGLPGPHDGGLVLALRGTHPTQPDRSGLPFQSLRRTIEGSRAERCVVVLDCGYAERAGTLARGPRQFSILAATGRDAVALAPSGHHHTSFTGALLQVLAGGIAGLGPTLLIDEIMQAVAAALQAQGLPRPQWQELDPGMALVRNAAYEAPRPEAAPGRWHAGFLADGTTGEDRLGVDRDVETLSDIVMAQEVAPPLAIGLFGDWGIGKSFFMGRMYDRVEALAAMSTRARTEGQPTAYCGSVCQVRFNAWHYVDANLWASLTGTIMDRLAEQLDDAAAGRALADLPSAQEQRHHLELRRRAAARQLAEATEDLLRQEPIGLRDVLGAEPVVAEAQSAVSKALSNAGVPPEGLDLRAVTQEARGTFGRFFVLLRRGTWATRSLLVSLVLLAVAGPAGAIVLARLQETLAAAATAVAPLVIAGLGLSKVIGRAKPALDKAEAVVRTLDEQRQEPIRVRRETLRRQIERYEDEIRTLGVRIDLLEQAGSVRSFAAGRSAGDDYRRHEGLVAVVRRDLEELSRRLSGSTDVERIVLYIDDLDRCPPGRVVDVLQAVNLLLAFPLFVVVVGVDARWLTRSLEQHYQEVIGGATEHDPQNYLEKIFQLSINLPALTDDGYTNLVRDTLLPDVEVDADLEHADAPPPLSPAPASPDSGPATGAGPADGAAAPTDGRQFAPVLVRGVELPDPVVVAGFTDGDRFLVAVMQDGTVARWDTARPADPGRRWRLWQEPVVAAAVTGDGRVFVVSAGRCGLLDAVELSVLAEAAWDGAGADGWVLAGVGPDPSGRTAAWIVTARAWVAVEFPVDGSEPSVDTTAGDLGGTVLATRQFRVVQRGSRVAFVPLPEPASSDTVPPPRRTAVAAADPAGAVVAVAVPHEPGVRLWRVVDGTPRPAALQPGTGTVAALAVSADGTLAATADRTLLLWDLTVDRAPDRFQLPAPAEPHDGPLSLPAFSADGRRLVLRTGLRHLAVYAVAKPDIPPMAVLTLRLTAQERQALIDVGPLITTPRSAKRLVNTYRLLRSGLTAAEAERLCDHDLRTVCLMLAMQVGFPAETVAFLERLADDDASVPDLLAGLPPALRDRVRRITDTTELDPDPATWRHWIPTVARFSFRSRPLMSR